MYQPIVRLYDGVPAGLEALVRWNHPRLGPLTPDRCMALAEETGPMVPLGRYVLRQACREAAGWAAVLQGFDLFVSVNVAAAQTHEPSLIDDVREIVAETGLKTAQLQLELTESALMPTSGAPLEALRAIADTGLRVAS